MNNSTNTDSQTLTVQARIELGRSGGAVADGAIVPFPAGWAGADILQALRGKERKKIDRFLAAGFQPTVYEYKSAEG